MKYASFKSVFALTGLMILLFSFNAKAQCTINISFVGASSGCGAIDMKVNSPLPGQTFQWQKDFVNIPGATGSTYSAPYTDFYQCIVTASCGTATSNILHPVVNYTSNIAIGGNTNFCSGNVMLQATGNFSRYQWYSGNDIIEGATDWAYLATGSGSYRCKVGSTICNNDYFTQTTIILNGPPSITASGPTSFCSGSVILHAWGGNTATSYQWKNNGVNIAGATSSSYTAIGSGNYTCDVNSTLCGLRTSNAIVVAVGSPTYPSMLSTPTYGSVQGYFYDFCGNKPTILIPDIPPVWPDYYVWQNVTSNQSLPSNSLNGDGALYDPPSGLYYVEYHQSCGTGYYAGPMSTGPYITVRNATPGYKNKAIVATTYGTTSFCNGDSVKLDVAGHNGVTYPFTVGSGQWENYKWFYNGANLYTGLGDFYAKQTGYYYCILTNSCDTNIVTDSIYVAALPFPSTNVTVIGSLNHCLFQNVTFNAAQTTGATYKWYRNNFPLTGSQGNSFTYITSSDGVYKVKITTGGCSVFSADYTVAIVPPPSTITPGGPTTVCSGNVVLNANTGTGLTYQWKVGGVNIPGATSASYTATATGSYTVVVTATGGCSATSAATVVTIGAMSAALTPAGTTSICAGTAITLSATTGSGYTYQWYRNNVLLSATTPTYSTTSGGTYKCVVTSGTCSATTNSVVVTQITNPTPTITYNSPLSFCSPGSVTLTANTFAGVAYQWENNSVPIPGATSQNYIATGPGLYRCNETANGCSRYTGKVSVSAATSAIAAISTNDPTTLCSGGSVNITVSNPIPGYSYQWKKNTVVIAGATATSYAATSSGSYTVTATASCGTATSNAIAVSIGSFAAQVTPSGNVAMCTGGSLTLTANTGTGFTYQWKKNNVNIAGATGATYSVTTAGSYTVAMTSPCGNGTSAATVVSQNTVTASLSPAGTSTVCSGTAQTFTANAGTGYTYRWYRNNILLSATTQTYTTTSDGSYKVEVSISGSCALLSNTAVLTVINNPTPTITASGPTTFCAGGSVTFTANTFAGVVYQWQKNSVNITGATNQSYTATTAGTYRANETANGCSKFTPKQSVIVNCRVAGETGDDIQTQTTIEVFPNPFADKLNIEITSPTIEQTEIKVMDVLGKVLYSQTITTNTTQQLDTQLPAGIYMVAATVDGQTKVVRVVRIK